MTTIDYPPFITQDGIRVPVEVGRCFSTSLTGRRRDAGSASGPVPSRSSTCGAPAADRRGRNRSREALPFQRLGKQRAAQVANRGREQHAMERLPGAQPICAGIRAGGEHREQRDTFKSAGHAPFHVGA